MNIEFTAHAWEEFIYWLETDIEIANKIKELLRSIRQSHSRESGNQNH